LSTAQKQNGEHIWHTFFVKQLTFFSQAADIFEKSVKQLTFDWMNFERMTPDTGGMLDKSYFDNSKSEKSDYVKKIFLLERGRERDRDRDLTLPNLKKSKLELI
jgi:hypothetical protein